MTNDEIIALKERLQFVTKGPWISIIEGRDQVSGSSFIETGDPDYSIDFDYLRVVDQDFIAESRTLVPYLLDEVLRLRNMLHGQL